MSNFLTDIEDQLGDEKPEAIVIGRHRSRYCECGTDQSSSCDDIYGTENKNVIPDDIFGVPFEFAKVKHLLDYDYDCGYGAQDCHSVIIWTATRVLFVHEYDGSTTIKALPRHPIAIVPYSC